LGQILDILIHAVVAYVVGCRLGPQQSVIPDVLFGEAMSIMTADDGVGEVEVFDNGLQFAPIFLPHSAAEDDRDLLRLADGSIHVQQALAEFVQGGTPEEDQIAAVLGLREEQPVLTGGLATFAVGEEGSEGRQPLIINRPVSLHYAVLAQYEASARLEHSFEFAGHSRDVAAAVKDMA
jgi:hypothetical protein